MAFRAILTRVYGPRRYSLYLAAERRLRTCGRCKATLVMGHELVIAGNDLDQTHTGSQRLPLCAECTELLHGWLVG